MKSDLPIDSATLPSDKAVPTVYDPRVTDLGPTPGSGIIDVLLRLVKILGKLF